jgi:hypothetical protein
MAAVKSYGLGQLHPECRLDRWSTHRSLRLGGRVTRVQVDFDVGTLARRLLRTHPGIVKPQDGVHLATALLNNVDEMHTYDRENLIGLSGLIERRDGARLRIGHPPNRPAPPAPEKTPIEEWLDEGKSQASGDGKG